MLEEGSAASETSSTSRDSKARNRKKRERLLTVDEPGPSTQLDDPAPTTPKRRETRQTVVPETPEEKLQIKEEQYDEVGLWTRPPLAYQGGGCWQPAKPTGFSLSIGRGDKPRCK